MSRATEQAADYVVGTPHPLQSVTASAPITLASLGIVPPCFVRLHADGVKAYVRWGSSAAVSVSASAFSTVTGNDASAAATAPHEVVLDGEKVRVRVPEGVTHMAHIESATGGFLRVASATGTG